MKDGGVGKTESGIVVYYTDKCSKVRALKQIWKYMTTIDPELLNNPRQLVKYADKTGTRGL